MQFTSLLSLFLLLIKRRSAPRVSVQGVGHVRRVCRLDRMRHRRRQTLEAVVLAVVIVPELLASAREPNGDLDALADFDRVPVEGECVLVRKSIAGVLHVLRLQVGEALPPVESVAHVD